MSFYKIYMVVALSAAKASSNYSNIDNNPIDSNYPHPDAMNGNPSIRF